MGGTECSHARALMHKLNIIDIYTNSWTDPTFKRGPNGWTEKAIEIGVTKVIRFKTLSN